MESKKILTYLSIAVILISCIGWVYQIDARGKSNSARIENIKQIDIVGLRETIGELTKTTTEFNRSVGKLEGFIQFLRTK